MNLGQLPVECQTVLTAGEPKDSVAQKAIAELAAARAAAKLEKAAKLAEKAKLTAAKAQNKSKEKPTAKSVSAKQ